MSRTVRLEFLRFGLVGVVNTLIDFVVFVALYRLAGLDPLAANVVAFLTAVSNSYVMNHRWTFHQSHSALSFSAYLRFVLVNIGGLIIGTLAILSFGRFMPLEIAKLIATAITLLVNFSSSKLLVFTNKSHG
jgi:putative flippase GtrA